MNITNNTNYSQTAYHKPFKSNPNSPKLIFENTDFFINITGYGKNLDWAKKVIKATEQASVLMRENMDFDEILSKLAKKMRKTRLHSHGDSKNHNGVLRTTREGYGKAGEWENLVTPYYRPGQDIPYAIYKSRFDAVRKLPLKTYYPGVSLTRMETRFSDCIMSHGENEMVNSALDIISEIYKQLQEKYISKPQNVTNKTLTDINSKIAEIRWILAHATPWERGSDAISNSFMRALYKSMGIKTYPAAKGVSFDLEAYCTELEDYKHLFSLYFTRPPKVVDDTRWLKITSFFKMILGLK